MSDLPAITGKQLIRLLRLDGWEERGRATHGIAFLKRDASGKVCVTVVPDKRSTLPDGTLGNILGHKQTCLTRNGLLELIRLHGLK